MCIRDRIKPAETVQVEEIQNLLKNSGLPFEDINKHLKDFLCLMNNEEIIAVGGMEIYDDVALLRSLAVVEGKRNQGLGQLVYSALIEHAKSKNIKQIYLLTETAEKFFLKNGFTKVERNIIPDKIKNTHEYKVLCALADFMEDKSEYENINLFYQQKRDLFLDAIKSSRFTFTPASGTYFQLLDYSNITCLLYTSPSPRDRTRSRMPSSA